MYYFPAAFMFAVASVTPVLSTVVSASGSIHAVLAILVTLVLHHSRQQWGRELVCARVLPYILGCYCIVSSDRQQQQQQQQQQLTLV